MAWVTALSRTQINDRLRADVGGLRPGGDRGRAAYWLDAERPTEWVGAGLREVGIEPGTPFDARSAAAARMLAKGCDPRTGEVLVSPKLGAHAEAKLDAGPLLAALARTMKASGATPEELLGVPRLVTRLEALQRGVARAERRAPGSSPAREPMVHRARIGDLQSLGAAAGIDLSTVYELQRLQRAHEFAKSRIEVGNRGYVLRFTVPKSYSVLMAMAPPDVAAELENVYRDAVRETVTALEGWASYVLRGHHGNGRSARRISSTGLLGWLVVRRTASPTAGVAPDPHLHAHVTVVNLARGIDGKWSTVGAGGRAIYGHAPAAHAYLLARVRAVSQQRWGVEWTFSPLTRAWEVAAVPPGLRAAFSKRSDRVKAQLLEDGIAPEQASTGQAQTAVRKSLEVTAAPPASGNLREEWHRQARELGFNPTEVHTAAMPGPGHAVSAAPILEQALSAGLRPRGSRKVIIRADVLTAMMDARPFGVHSVAEAELLVDQFLAEPVTASAAHA